MGFANWLDRTVSKTREKGWRGVEDGLYELYTGAWRKVGWHVPRGTNIYDRQWDLLIILDACRVDLLREVAPDYEFIGDVKSFESVGSMSQEWMAKTFTEEYAEEMKETVYVTANVFTEEELGPFTLRKLDEVWRYGWDKEVGVVPPRPVTDRAIAAGRKYDPERMIVHYMQPHHPFIADDVDIGEFDSDPFGREGKSTVVDALRRGEIDDDVFWKAYRSNLELVLEDVKLLLSNCDADRTVITADHGDALGEWGIYDHPAGCLHPVVKNVPWVETTAVDENTHIPDAMSETEADVDVIERLRDLGYR